MDDTLRNTNAKDPRSNNVSWKTFKITAWLIASVLICCVGYYLYGLFIAPRFVSGNTLIDVVQSGEFSEDDVSRMAFLSFSVRDWPFSESDYQALPSINVENKEQRAELLLLLKNGTTKGHKHRNHPEPLHYGILLVEFGEHGHFYMFYRMYRDWQREIGFVDLNALVEGKTNPNGGQTYESVDLYRYLLENDPWLQKAK